MMSLVYANSPVITSTLSPADKRGGIGVGAVMVGDSVVATGETAGGLTVIVSVIGNAAAGGEASGNGAAPPQATSAKATIATTPACQKERCFITHSSHLLLRGIVTCDDDLCNASYPHNGVRFQWVATLG